MIPAVLDLDAIPIASSWRVSRSGPNYTLKETLCSGHLYLASAGGERWAVEGNWMTSAYCARCDLDQRYLRYCQRRGITAWGRILSNRGASVHATNSDVRTEGTTT